MKNPLKLIPRLPVFGWSSLAGERHVQMPCMLSLPGMTYTTSGRASILLALELLGVKAGDRVLVPTYHCPTMVAPVVRLGAEPSFYPIDANGTPNLAWLSQQDLSNTRVLLAAHLFGLPQPMALIRRWCDAHHVVLIEDCAHALFGRSDGRPIGAWGDMSIGSLTKFLPLPLGGCLVVNNGALNPNLHSAGQAAELRVVVDVLDVAAQHRRVTGLNQGIAAALGMARGMARGMRRPGKPKPAAAQAREDAAAAEEAAHSVDAEVAHQMLPGLARWAAEKLPRGRNVALRRRRYEELATRLSGVPGMRPLMPILPDDCAPYVLPLWVDHPDPGYARLRERGMPVSRWNWLWPGVPQLPGDHGTRWAHHVLQLACHQDLTDDDVNRLVTALHTLYSQTPGIDTAVAAPEVSMPMSI